MGNFLAKKNIYKSFFTHTIKLLCVVNHKGYFIGASKQFCQETGYTLAELRKTTYLEHVPYNDREESIRLFNILLHEKQLTYKSNFITKDKKIITVEWSSCMDDKTKHIYCSAHNITTTNIVLDELLLYKSLLDESEKLSLSGCWSWNIKTGEMVWTDGLKRIYNLDNPTYETYMAANHPDDREFIQSTVGKCVQDKEPYEFTHRLIVNGEIKFLNARGHYILNTNNEPCIRGVGRDITTQKYIEDKIIEARKVAERASEMKSAFVANISHEIRTPINGIIGSVSLLKDRTYLDDDLKESLEIISYSSGVLLSIINNVLDFSKIESGIVNMEFNNIYLHDFISSIINSFKNTVPETIHLKLYIASNVPSSITTDRIKLRQIIINLLSNSVKFTTFGTISLLVTAKNSDIIFEVKDTGIGIPDNIIGTLFEPFTQADITTTRIYGGTGLGLSICKKLVHLLKGEINISSKVNLGTSIIFSIKNEHEETGNKQIETETEPEIIDSTNDVEIIIPCNENEIEKLDKKIIIVEDNRINQIIMKKTLERLNYNNITIYANGREVENDLERIQHDKIDLILMDIHMPFMDGYETAIMLRKAGIIDPIIAVSANGLSGEKEKCINIGMNDFLLKPVHIKDLKNCINKWVN